MIAYTALFMPFRKFCLLPLLLAIAPFLQAVEPLPLSNSFAPPLHGYGQVPEMAWNPVSEWLYCRVSADRMNGQALTTNLIRFDAEGNWDDSWALSHMGDITAILVQPDGKILIGGDFFSVDGHGSSRVARLNVDGSVDTTFESSALPDTPYLEKVTALAVDSVGRVYVGFTDNTGASDLGSVYQLSDTGDLENTTSLSDAVTALACMSGDRVLIASGDKVTRYNSSLSKDQTFDIEVEMYFPTEPHWIFIPPALINEIYVYNQSGSETIWVAGRFNVANGTERHGLALFDDSGAILSSEWFDVELPFSYSSVDYIHILDLDIAGGHLAYAGLRCRFIAQHVDAHYGDELGYIDLSSHAKSHRSDQRFIGSVEYADGSMVFGRNLIATAQEYDPALYFDSTGVSDEIKLYGPRAPSGIWLRSGGGVFLVGSHIREVAGDPVPGLVALDSEMNLDASFQPDFEELFIRQLLSLPDGRTLILGTIDGRGSLLVLLEEDGHRIEGFEFTTSSSYLSSAQDYIWLMPSGKVLLSGFTLNESTTSNLLLLDLSNLDEKLALAETLPGGLIDCGIIDDGFQPDPTLTAYDAVGLDDGRIVITGSFDSGSILMLNSDGSLDSTFNPEHNFAEFPRSYIERDAQGRLYLRPYGSTSIGFETTEGLNYAMIRLLPTGEPDLAYGLDYPLLFNRRWIIAADGSMFIWGSFSDINGIRSGVVRIDPNGQMDDAYYVPDSSSFTFSYRSGTIYSAYIDRTIARWGLATIPDPLPPEAYITPSIVKQSEGDDITFWLADRGAGETYQWLNNGEALAGQTGPSLTLDPTSLANAGEISVEATGPGGVVTRSATLEVAGLDFADWGAMLGFTSGELADPDADPDGNSLSLNDEFLLRTDLGGLATRSWVAPVYDEDGLTLRWRMLPGRLYWVDCSTDLDEWTPVGSYSSEASEWVELPVNFDPLAPCFYRVRVELSGS